jgi:glycosyltransferase involved in cell wall biosynthesis
MLITSLLIIGLLGSTYSYFIYPIILSLLNKRKPSDSPPFNKNNLPKISFIITAFNEQDHIKNKIINTLAIDYPSALFEIIVASDGSTDNTNSIVESFAEQGVKLALVTEQKGKENAQKYAISQATGTVLVFSDVSTKVEPHCLYVIAESFNDPSVGAVSSEDRFISADGTVAGEGAYVKYEMWLRKLEGSVNSLVGLSGSFFAARSCICQDWDITVPSDFNTALNAIKNDQYAISNPKLLGFYPNLKDETKEYQRKVRTVIRGIAALISKREVCSPSQYGIFAFQILSHKVMRWLVPWFLLISLVSNAFLWQQGLIFNLLMIAQLCFYSLALLGWLSDGLRKNSMIKIAYFFVQVNIAIGDASIQYLSGKRITRWAPSKR